MGRLFRILFLSIFEYACFSDYCLPTSFTYGLIQYDMKYDIN